MPETKRYKMNGTITISYTWVVDTEAEADDQEEAIDALIEELDPTEALETDIDVLSLDIEEIEPGAELSEAERMKALGMPMLPGF